MGALIRHCYGLGAAAGTTPAPSRGGFWAVVALVALLVFGGLRWEVEL